MISLALEVVRIRMLSPHTQISFESIQGYKERIRKIMVEAKPHLQDAQWCTNSPEHLERVVLKLHSSYISSELCRPSLKPSVDANDADVAESYRIVRAELEAYGAGLADKPVVVALNKIDTLDDELIEALSAELAEASGAEVVPISGAGGTGLDWVLDRLTAIAGQGTGVPEDDEGEDAVVWSPI